MANENDIIAHFSMQGSSTVFLWWVHVIIYVPQLLSLLFNDINININDINDIKI